MNWQTKLQNTIDGFTQDMEALVDEISRDAMGALDRLVELSNDFGDDVTNTIRHEFETPSPLIMPLVVPITNFLDRDLEEFLDSLLRPFIDLSMEDFNSHNSSRPQAHALCENCENYHGQSYGGTPLVCGMHPYGPDLAQTECGDRSIKPTELKAEDRSSFPPDWWNS
jgi:hypothetical protein